MPTKGKKAASRQAGLRNKKRRGKSAPQHFQSAPTSRKLEDEEGTPVTTPTISGGTTTARSQPRRETRLSRKAKQAAAESVVLYPYMGAEVRHIGILATGILAIIIALSFVLD